MKNPYFIRIAIALLILAGAAGFGLRQHSVQEERRMSQKRAAELAYAEIYSMAIAHDYSPILLRVEQERREVVKQSLDAFRPEFLRGMYNPSEIVGVTLDGANDQLAAIRFPADATGVGNSVLLENNGKGWFLRTIGMWTTEEFNKGLE